MASAEVQGALQGLSDKFTKLQQDQQKLITAQQRLNAQRTENEGVKKEFDKLKDGEVIYKLVGPVLLRQDKLEADSTVNGRLGFITKEMDRLDGEIKESTQKLDNVKDQIMTIQGSAQGAAPGKSGTS